MKSSKNLHLNLNIPKLSYKFKISRLFFKKNNRIQTCVFYPT